MTLLEKNAQVAASIPLGKQKSASPQTFSIYLPYTFSITPSIHFRYSSTHNLDSFWFWPLCITNSFVVVLLSALLNTVYSSGNFLMEKKLLQILNKIKILYTRVSFFAPYSQWTSAMIATQFVSVPYFPEQFNRCLPGSLPDVCTNSGGLAFSSSSLSLSIFS